MSRFGGAATVGRMWTTEDVSKYDEYPQRRGVTGNQVAVGGGLAATALGAHQLAGANRVPDQAVERAHGAVAQFKQASGARARAAEELRHQTAMSETSGRFGKWRRKGKVREAAHRAEAANRQYDKTKHLAEVQRTHLSPEQMVKRTKNMRLLGGAAIVGGLGAATSPLWRKKRAEPSLVVEKTITQARYGGLAEMGRAWDRRDSTGRPTRGPEKKDAKAPLVAAGGAGVGALGAATALAAHRSKPKAMPDRTPELQAGVRQAEKGVEEAGREWGRQQGKYKRAADAGRNARYVRSLELAAMRGRDVHQAAQKVEAEAASALSGHAGERAANATKRLRHLRATKAGAAVAGLGAATALGAGIKAERDRNKATPNGGWGKPKRQVRKALVSPTLVQLATGLPKATAKTVTPKPVKNALRPIKQGFREGQLRAAEQRAWKEAGMSQRDMAAYQAARR